MANTTSPAPKQDPLAIDERKSDIPTRMTVYEGGVYLIRERWSVQNDKSVVQCQYAVSCEASPDLAWIDCKEGVEYRDIEPVELISDLVAVDRLQREQAGISMEEAISRTIEVELEQKIEALDRLPKKFDAAFDEMDNVLVLLREARVLKGKAHRIVAAMLKGARRKLKAEL
jgi:hypothetical protein